MLEKERFLEIKKLARAIRRENENLFTSLNKVTLEEAIKEKEEFIEAIINNMGIRFSLGEQGKEEKQIFRANILIPDDNEFFETYSKDKNIRNLMNRYLVNIEDVMSKITELNIYGKYIKMAEEEPRSFVEEMTKKDDVTNDALDLLDEIKSLTKDIDKTLEKVEKEPVSDGSMDVFATPLDSINLMEEEPAPATNLLEPEEISSVSALPEEDLSAMNQAVSSFVDKYNELKNDNSKMIDELEELKSQIQLLNSTLVAKEKEIEEASKENMELKAKNEKLESQVVESKALITKIYSCIAPE